MKLEKLFSARRVGSSNSSPGIRSGFQRDYDRLIFSSAFRRLQNKTQVFPLPGTAFVHNRLTHSLEVASVGRSLGKLAGAELAEGFSNSSEAYEFYRYELPNVIAAACLAHDIGNPAFGHSGESAISAYFIEHEQEIVEGKKLADHFNPAEWSDLLNFEGNANAVRILTHSFQGRFNGGFGLTYTTIASILKYPCESVARDKSFLHRKKYGFFQSEKETIREIATFLELPKESESPLIYKRHPFVFLVEAADDICYNIMDMEDAQRLGILDSRLVSDAFFNLIGEIADKDELDKTKKSFEFLKDENESIAFLRAKVINTLINQTAKIFLDHRPEILTGNFNESLMGKIKGSGRALREIEEISMKKIYRHEKVVQIEIAGYHVMSELLQLLVPALLAINPLPRQRNVLQLIPDQFTGFKPGDSAYTKVLSALDFLSGMTDEYATELYRRLKGIVVPSHR